MDWRRSTEREEGNPASERYAYSGKSPNRNPVSAGAVNTQNHGSGWAEISPLAVLFHHDSQPAVLLQHYPISPGGLGALPPVVTQSPKPSTSEQVSLYQAVMWMSKVFMRQPNTNFHSLMTS